MISKAFSLVDNNLKLSWWLSSLGRVRALLEIRIDSEGADVIILGGNVDEVTLGLENSIFPADKVNFEGLRKVRRVQILEPLNSNGILQSFWIDGNSTFPEDLSSYKFLFCIKIHFHRNIM